MSVSKDISIEIALRLCGTVNAVIGTEKSFRLKFQHKTSCWSLAGTQLLYIFLLEVNWIKNF